MHLSKRELSEKEYQDTIDALTEAKTQLKPDGRCCVVCGDTDHQAWECHHNPMRWMLYGKQIITGSFWRCFHCGAEFTEMEKAQEHFGPRFAVDADEINAAACIAELKDQIQNLHGQLIIAKHIGPEVAKSVLAIVESKGDAYGLSDKTATAPEDK